MAYLDCPHCGKEIELALTPASSALMDDPEERHSTFVKPDPEQIANGNGYHPSPSKVYRSPESQRRSGLAYYYRNREQVLAKAKAKRQRARQEREASGD